MDSTISLSAGNGVVTTYWPEHNVIQSIKTYKDNLLHGDFKMYFPDEELHIRAVYDKGQLCSYYEFYDYATPIDNISRYGSTNLMICKHYEQDKISQIDSFSVNGREHIFERYEKGELVHTKYIVDAIDIIVKEYIDNKIHTKMVRNDDIITHKKYFSDGSKQLHYSIKDGQKEGEYKEYELTNDGSRLIIHKLYENNIVTIDYLAPNKKNGQFIDYYDLEHVKIGHIKNYVNDQLEGAYKYYNDNGYLIVDGFYNNGKKSGEWKTYRISGTIHYLYSIKYYENDKLHGNFKRFYPNNLIKTNCTYKHDELDGMYMEYSENGTLLTCRQYRADNIKISKIESSNTNITNSSNMSTDTVYTAIEMADIMEKAKFEKAQEIEAMVKKYMVNFVASAKESKHYYDIEIDEEGFAKNMNAFIERIKELEYTVDSIKGIVRISWGNIRKVTC